MSVKTENVEMKNDIENDISENEEMKDNSNDLDQDKLAALKAKMAEKQNKDEDMPPKIVKKREKSIRFGVVGSGQAGGRLSESFYNLGYDAIAINTASVDLEYINIPEENKLLLEYGLGGASKMLSVGQEAAETYADNINELISDKLSNAQVFIACMSLGGGSGAGSCEPLINVLNSTGKPVIVMTILPLSTDDAITKSNALTTLSKLSKMAQNKEIANLIVVDNAKIETIYNDVSQMDFFKVSNQAIVEPLDAFNKFSAQPSKVKALDSMEFARILTDGEGLCSYGKMTVFEYEEETAIAEAVINNLKSGLLAGGFDLKQTRYAGMLVIAHPDVWATIPNGSINYARALMQEECSGSEALFHGIYEDAEMEKDRVEVFSIFSGLGLPTSRIEQLKKDAETEMGKSKDREKNRNLNLNLDTGQDEAVSDADKVRQMIKKKKSTFGKNFIGNKDFRRK